MEWYTLELSTLVDEHGQSEFSVFCSQFDAVYRLANCPEDMGLLVGEWDTGLGAAPSARVYVSPGSLPYALGLLLQYHCQICPQPPRPPLIHVVGLTRSKRRLTRSA